MSEDRRIEEALRGLYGVVDTRGVWASVQARAGVQKAGQTRRLLCSGRLRRPSGRALRTALAASLAVMLLGGVVAGGVVAIRHLSERRPAIILDGGPGLQPSTSAGQGGASTTLQGGGIHTPQSTAQGTGGGETALTPDLLARFTTTRETSQAHEANVRVATRYASGVVLAPGEEYDFDKVIGPRTAARGFKTSPGIIGTGEMDDALGGGITQVATTLFNAVFEAGLQILERHNGSVYVSQYPDGRDAAITSGSKNLRFRNDTAGEVRIVGTSDGVTTTFEIYGVYDGRKVTSQFSGFEVGPTATTVATAPASGNTAAQITVQPSRSCTVTRTITYADGTKHIDTFQSYYPQLPAV